MSQAAYTAFKNEHRHQLEMRIAQFVQGLNEDPYEVLERNGAANSLIDVVAEQYVFRAFIARATSIESAIKDLDAWTVIFVESEGPLADPYMRSRVNTWIQGWRRRLEKLQRENPNV